MWSGGETWMTDGETWTYPTYAKPTYVEMLTCGEMRIYEETGHDGAVGNDRATASEKGNEVEAGGCQKLGPRCPLSRGFSDWSSRS